MMRVYNLKQLCITDIFSIALLRANLKIVFCFDLPCQVLFSLFYSALQFCTK